MKKLKKVFLFVLFQFFFGAMLAPFLIFWGPFSSVKAYAVGAVVTSRHPQFIKLFLSDAQVKQILQAEQQREEVSSTGGLGATQTTNVVDTGGIQIKDIRGRTYRGKVMLIQDPARVQVAVTNAMGESGERVSEMAKRLGAVAAINAGGFNDPNGKGNGGFPMGAVIHAGKVLYDDSNGASQAIIGIDTKGKLIVDTMTTHQAMARGIQEAISFYPSLVQDGRGVVKGDGGWGVGPRTAIGQLADGTIMFVVIDGRQIQSLGATLRDLQQIFLDYGAVTAVNLDGGSSTTLYYDGQIINRPADIFGERYVPTAFVVMPKE